LRKALDSLLVWVKYYCIAVVLVMLGIAFIQVVRRYGFNIPWSWSDEIVLLLLSWFAYPSIVVNTWKDDHFYIGSFYERLPPSFRKAADIFRYLLQGIFLVLLAYFGVLLTQQYWRKPLPASGMPQGLKYIPVVFAAGLSTFFCLVNLVKMGEDVCKRRARSKGVTKCPDDYHHSIGSRNGMLYRYGTHAYDADAGARAHGDEHGV
jgi:TRAP-type C4-dicarboxylate transport system permease small subunit